MSLTVTCNIYRYRFFFSSFTQHLDDWSFNVFNVNSASDGHALKYVGYELLQKYDLITKFKISNSVLDSFLLAIEVGYSKHKNPYHNLIHGGDVAQTVHTILSQSKLVVSSDVQRANIFWLSLMFFPLLV